MSRADASAALATARSLLFVPGDRPDRFAKASDSGCDVVVTDLEDAVAEADKVAARGEVMDWIASGGRACVRINAAGHPAHRDDVAALSGLATPSGVSGRSTVSALPGLVAVMMPKAEDPTAVAAVAERLGVPVIALIESAAGVARAHEIAAASGVARIAFGQLDYAADVGADPTATAMLFARSCLVLASRTAGLPAPIDGVTIDLDTPVALNADIAHARELGYTGKLLIHPAQVDPTHAALRPSTEAVDWARQIVRAAGTGGAVRVKCQMVDAPVLARARAIIDQAGG